MDADTAALFEENLEALERLNRDVFMPYGASTASPGPIYTAPDITISASVISGDITVGTPPPLTDYDRLLRLYCVSLWTCWEIFKRARRDTDFDDFLNGKGDMIELRGLRNCLVHYNGNVQRATQDVNELPVAQARALTANGTAKGYIKFENIYLEQTHLEQFTATVRARYSEWRTQVGI